MRVLLDECVPKRLKGALPDHAVATVVEMGWSGVKNGKLLALAAGRFDCFLTVDASIEHQQHLAAVPIAILLVRATSNDLETLVNMAVSIRDALNVIEPRTFMRVAP